MPELPEVESIRADLQNRLEHDCKQKVRKNSAQIHFRRLAYKRSKIVTFPNCSGTAENLSILFSKEVSKSQLVALRRCGKFLLLCFLNVEGKWEKTSTTKLFKNCVAMLVHLRMSGAFLDSRYSKAPSPAHEHFALHFADFTLYYVDPRTFSTVECFFSLNEALQFLHSKKLGFEGTDLDRAKIFFNRSHDSQRHVKALLLDQTKIMGLGNIYANEALFYAGISPKRSVKSLTLAERERLALLIPLLLRFAIAVKGVTIEKTGGYRLPDGGRGGYKAHAMVYGRVGERCKKRGDALSKLLRHFENKAKESKAKESKVKESKVKESKVKERPQARAKDNKLMEEKLDFTYLKSGEIPPLATTVLSPLSATQIELLKKYLEQANDKGKAGAQCDRSVEKITQNGRSTFYCPKCQA